MVGMEEMKVELTGELGGMGGVKKGVREGEVR